MDSKPSKKIGIDKQHTYCKEDVLFVNLLIAPADTRPEAEFYDIGST